MIIVREEIPHVYDVAPRDVWLSVYELPWQRVHRLADNNKVVEHGIKGNIGRAIVTIALGSDKLDLRRSDAINASEDVRDTLVCFSALARSHSGIASAKAEAATSGANN